MFALVLTFLAIPLFASTVAAEDPPTFVLKWGTLGSDNGQFANPTDIAVDSTGNVYVAEHYNERIQKFNSLGNFLTKWGTLGSGDGQFESPNGVAVDSTGNVYVVEDDINCRIQKFDSAGNFLTKWGAPGSGNGEFGQSKGVAVDSTGNVYVADFLNNRIQKFNNVGNFLTKWGTPGAGNGEFSYPIDVAVDSTGDVYVADYGNYRIQKFDSVGNLLTKWGTPGAGDGEFSYIGGIGVDSTGDVYVADTGNDRIQKFDSVGNFLTKWGTLGAGDGQFDNPGDVAVDSEGNIYVVDEFNHRIQKFGAPGPIKAVLRLPKNIQWKAEAILLDGINTREKYSIPVKEAARFISSNSRFKVTFSDEVFDNPHTYTFYDCYAGLQKCVVVNKGDIDPSIWESVPTRDFYMLLWDTAGNPLLQAGSTWGVSEGVQKGGLNRPYITIPVDPWWYNNEPFEGFSSRAAQIMTHEIINAINAKLEVEPYNCSPLVADPGITYASDYEASRLSKLTDDCYLKYLDVRY